MQKIATHREQSRIFLTQAFEELAEGDLPQASEKGWGAATQMLKAIAQKRGWSNSKHSDITQVIWDLRLETGDENLSVLYSAASTLHYNFYEIKYPAHYVEDLLRQVELLVDKLEGMLDAPA